MCSGDRAKQIAPPRGSRRERAEQALPTAVPGVTFPSKAQGGVRWSNIASGRTKGEDHRRRSPGRPCSASGPTSEDGLEDVEQLSTPLPTNATGYDRNGDVVEGHSTAAPTRAASPAPWPGPPGGARPGSVEKRRPRRSLGRGQVRLRRHGLNLSRARRSICGVPAGLKAARNRACPIADVLDEPGEGIGAEPSPPGRPSTGPRSPIHHDISETSQPGDLRPGPRERNDQGRA